MNWQSIFQPLNLKVINLTPISGGDIHSAYRLHTAEKDYFLKLNHISELPLFEAEADSLKAIGKSHTIDCPQPIKIGTTANHAYLLMDFLPLTAQGDDFQRGQMVAMMHHNLNPTGQYGWHQDNFIGHTPQPNRWHDDWISFYAEQRLRPQLQLAQKNGASHQLLKLGEQLIEQLPQFFTPYAPVPSLLHGDLWSGNSAFLTDGTPVIYDPACYYGDRETDLAMTELFGGFSQAFYDGYHHTFPIDAGYTQRKPLYQLYHILNHFNLFGGHYQQQALRTMQSLLK